MFDVPVLFVVFNRPEQTRRVFEVIKQVQPAKLFIAADGPRVGYPADAEKCRETRSLILNNIDWPCEVKMLFQETNLGCGAGPVAGFRWFFDQVNEGIILEDDCLPDISFFRFCREMLEKYRDNESVVAVSGCNLNYQYKDGSVFYSRYFNMWGWATWKRVIEKIDFEMKLWKNFTTLKKYRFLISRLGFTDWGWIHYWMKQFNYVNPHDTWDYIFLFHQLYERKYCVFPASNLVINLGFGLHATHTLEETHPVSYLKHEPLSFPLLDNRKLKNDKHFEEHYIKKIWCNYHKPGFFRQVQHFLSSVSDLLIHKFKIRQ